MSGQKQKAKRTGLGALDKSESLFELLKLPLKSLQRSVAVYHKVCMPFEWFHIETSTGDSGPKDKFNSYPTELVAILLAPDSRHSW